MEISNNVNGSSTLHADAREPCGLDNLRSSDVTNGQSSENDDESDAKESVDGIRTMIVDQKDVLDSLERLEKIQVTRKATSEESDYNENQTETLDALLKSKELIIERLQKDLWQARSELKTKDEKCGRLEQIQNKVDGEIQDLTASLFEEAYRMVHEANEKRVLSEKLLAEANGKIELFQAEVEALKKIVLTSTPSSPNKHLFPHLSMHKSSSQKNTKNKLEKPSFGHKRNYSDSTGSLSGSAGTVSDDDEQRMMEQLSEFPEIDPVYHKEFVAWREKVDPSDKKHPFLRRIYDEDILPCFDFNSSQLSTRVLTAVEKNAIIMERTAHDDRAHVKTCALSLVPRVCSYRLKFEDTNLNENETAADEEWLPISTMCRNRIASVCNFLTYLRYLNQGLVKCSVNEAYTEIIRLRRGMALARLGYALGS